MNKLIIIRGIPGSGKTTFKDFFSFYNIFEFDEYWLPYCGRDCGEMKRKMYEDVKKSLEEKTTVVVNVFSRVSQMQPYLHLSDDVLVIRIIGHHQNLHDVSNSFVREFESNFEDYKGEILINNEKRLF